MINGLEESGSAPDSDASTALTIIEKLLAQLDPAEAWLIRTIELEEQSLAELCERTGWNPNTARVRLYRARQRLKKVFEELEKPMPSHANASP